MYSRSFGMLWLMYCTGGKVGWAMRPVLDMTLPDRSEWTMEILGISYFCVLKWKRELFAGSGTSWWLKWTP
jgi:hypothetical protein